MSMKQKGFEMGEREKRFLYDASLREALEVGYDDEEDEKQRVTTSMHTPLWIRKILADMRDAYDIPFYVVTSRILRLGVSRLQKEYGVRLKTIRNGWHTLRWSDNYILSNIEETEFTVNGTSELKHKTIVMPLWCNKALSEITGAINVNKSAVMRLAIYLALVRDNDDLVSVNNRRHAESEIAKFDKLINDSVEFLEAVVTRFKNEAVEEEEEK